jgi:hypothetical protein
MRRAVENALLAALLAAAVPALGQQNEDILRPPRLDREAEAARQNAPGAPPTGAAAPFALQLRQARPPNAARLAPLPEHRASEPDEIIVIGEGWRLPDLGSAWRQKQAEENRRVTLLPLYDPNNPQTWDDTFLANREVTRVGFIDLFRVRFGRRRPVEE